MKSKLKAVSASAAIIITILAISLIYVHNTIPSQTQSADTIIVSGSLAAKEVPQLIESSDTIVYGTIIQKDDPIKIQPVTGGDFSLFTDYYVEIETVFASTTATTDTGTIPVRVQGGVIDGLNVLVEEAPTLEIGEKYLLFLYKPGRGGGYNTAGEYFYVTGTSQGAYNYVNSELISQFDNSILTLENLQSQIDQYEALDLPRKTAMEIFIENQNRNLESGSITVEEYNIFIENANTYATIID